jgi:predicted AlkP superfamily pyrophosphatase or phosphodiesterase
VSAPHDTLLLVVADGVRPDVLFEELEAGHLPRLAARSAAGFRGTVSSCFPSVTGPAYAPFLMGRFPAAVGVPGLRWYDRARETCRWPPFARSYVGPEIRHLDNDLDADAPTLLELATPSVAGATLLGRGARGARHPGRGLAWALRALLPHFRGDLAGWRRIEQLVADRVLGHLQRDRPRCAVMTFLTPDKFAHAAGARSAAVRTALRDLDAFVGAAEDIAAAGGWAHRLHVWLVADHGHADVAHHDELADGVRDHGLRVLAHPAVWVRRPDAAVMVGGNAMAHVYVDLPLRRRPWWPRLADRWTELHDALLARPSVDLVAVALDERTVRVRHGTRGAATIIRDGAAHDPRARWSCRFDTGDPLGLGRELHAVSSLEAHEACAAGDYPDAVVQLGDVVPSRRAGDLVLSAATGWDLRDRFEPTPHRSTHGALHREQLLVPLLTDSPVARRPRRSADVLPSALTLLGLPVPAALDGVSWR